MSSMPEIDRFAEVIGRQVELLEETAQKQQELQRAVIDRNWHTLDELLRELDTLGEEIHFVEEKRRAMYEQVCDNLRLENRANFYDVLCSLDNSDRNRLNDVYRRLKVAVMRVRNATDGLDAYVSAAGDTLHQVLGEVFPERKGTVYARDGSKAGVTERPLVVDQEL